LNSSFFILLSPIPGIVSVGTIFPFTYMCTQYLHCIHPPMPAPHLLHPPTGTNPSGRTCSAFLLVYYFFKGIYCVRHAISIFLMILMNMLIRIFVYFIPLFTVLACFYLQLYQPHPVSWEALNFPLFFREFAKCWNYLFLDN
jgi:hypothetical protein